MAKLLDKLGTLKDRYKSIRSDGWMSTLTGQGVFGRNRSVSWDFERMRDLTDHELMALFEGDWLAGRIVEAIPREVVKLGVDLYTDDPEGEGERLESEWELLDTLKGASVWARLYGGSIVWIGLDGMGEQDEPVDLSMVRPGTLRFFHIVERPDITIQSFITDPESPDFGEPELYRIHTTNGQEMFVHSSRTIRFRGAPTTSTTIRRRHGWDLSVLQRVWSVLIDYNANWRNINDGISDMSQAVFKIHDLISMIANGQEQVMLQRMELVDLARSVSKAIIVDAEHESFEHVGAANLGSVAPLLDKQFVQISAAAGIPATVLLGMSPAGMDATGESDIRLWFDTVRIAQEMAEMPMRTMMQVAARNAGLPVVDESSFTPIWPSLWQLSPEEEAARAKVIAETFALYIQNEVILPEQAALALFVAGVKDGTIPDEFVDEEALRAALAQEIELLQEPPADPPPPPQFEPAQEPEELEGDENTRAGLAEST